MTIARLRQINEQASKIQRLKGLIEVGESETLTDERFLSELLNNPFLLSVIKKYAILFAKEELLQYEKEFEAL